MFSGEFCMSRKFRGGDARMTFINDHDYVATLDDNEVSFCICHTEGTAENPCVHYDGGPHALLCWNRNVRILLEYLHEEQIRDRLINSREVEISEYRLPTGGLFERLNFQWKVFCAPDENHVQTFSVPVCYAKNLCLSPHKASNFLVYFVRMLALSFFYGVLPLLFSAKDFLDYKLLANVRNRLYCLSMRRFKKKEVQK
jgi:hypothetical protein